MLLTQPPLHHHTHFTQSQEDHTVNVKTKFLGLQIQNHLHWKDHTEQTIPKLSGACYAVRSMAHISNINTLKSIEYAYFCSIINYGIIFWGKSSNSGKILTLQ